ncbi:MAG TPA: hypothetical protein VFX59_11775 [Polyangiales bacterium]|nr:hypothetical protein [Polyangiales bacterium]
MKRLALACLLASACKRAPPKPEARAAQVTRQAEKVAEPITLAAGASETVAIGDGVQVVLYGPGRYLLRGEQLLVGEGLVRVDVAAQAGRHAFALASPAGQLEVPFASRLVLHAPRQHAAELALVSGEALADGSLPVGANRRVCFGAVGPHVLAMPGFRTVEAALEALPSSHACDPDQAPELAKLDRELAQQLELFTRNKAEQDALVASAREHPAASLVQDLAARGQLTLAARTRALALRAQLSAAQLGAANDPARTALLARANELEDPAH